MYENWERVYDSDGRISNMKEGRTQILRLVLLLTFGAVFNLAVGWSLYFWSERPSFQRAQRYEDRPIRSREMTEWRRWSQDDWPAEPQAHLAYRAFGIRYQEIFAIADDSESARVASKQQRAHGGIRKGYWLYRTDCGWPMPCLTIKRSSNEYPRRTTPILGFLVNTLLYGGLLWIVVRVPSAIVKSGQW